MYICKCVRGMLEATDDDGVGTKWWEQTEENHCSCSILLLKEGMKRFTPLLFLFNIIAMYTQLSGLVFPIAGGFWRSIASVLYIYQRYRTGTHFIRFSSNSISNPVRKITPSSKSLPSPVINLMNDPIKQSIRDVRRIDARSAYETNIKKKK